MKRLLKKTVQFLRSLGRDNTQIFDDIYEKGGWGATNETPDGLSSGSGSSEENSKPYVEFVARHINAHGYETIVDVGCGDFRVAQRILCSLDKPTKYVGVDVSSKVIERNSQMYSSDDVHFLHLDATQNELPGGDIVLVREVMQHLSNASVSGLVTQVLSFPDNIVTNTQAIGGNGVNIDIASGASSRAALGSGLWLDNPPFDLDITELARWSHADRPTEIVSVRINKGDPA